MEPMLRSTNPFQRQGCDMFTFSRGVLLLAFLTVLPPTYANEEPAMLTSEHPIQPPVAAKHPRTLKKHGKSRLAKRHLSASPRENGTRSSR